ncbi:MAG: hypothetical protein DSZ19_00210 [Candidatus Thioglobus sp.]|nr:MAG: hypothetical protein DSZ19_00210 [Candidatus Thioglobus sp.]RUM86697.1 MAG: hypothetical protein DSZ20_00975 [Candidatus Thioglobus sp.]
MKKYSLLLLFVFLSSIVFSASNMYVAQDSVALRSDKLVSDTNTIKNLSKDTQLTLISMHYSGWSKVSIDDLTGWILSDQLTKKAPESLIINKVNTDTNKIKSLEQVLLRLKNENNNLIAKIIDMKAISDKQITSDLNKVKADVSQENIDSQSIKNTLPLSDSNALLLLVVGLVLGLIISFIFSRILRRRNNKLNIVSRSY